MGACVVSGLIFAITFVVIISEKVHRTIAALVGASVMLIVGMLMGFYSQEKAIESIDWNTLGLLLGMMILVGMLEKTGFFEYLAIITAKRSKGKPWYLMIMLGVITAVVSMFLDNVTTVVLIVPITILITEILGINPIPILMAEALLSNVGGVATLVGDPPNILIASAGNLSFNAFLTHLAPIVFVAGLAALLLLRFIFSQELSEKPQDIEALMKLDENGALKDRKSLTKILITIGFVILLFFVHHLLHLKPAAVALIGASLALVWVRPNIKEVLNDVEWSVLLFFAAIFVAVGGVESSGLLQLGAGKITGLAQANLLSTAILLIWGSATLCAVMSNIPFTIAMIPVIQHLGTQGINVTPLWWALALGAGFGANGILIASAAGVVTATLSEKTKTPINFKIWLKSGLPVMLATCVIATIIFVLAFQYMK